MAKNGKNPFLTILKNRPQKTDPKNEKAKKGQKRQNGQNSQKAIFNPSKTEIASRKGSIFEGPKSTYFWPFWV